MEQPSPPLPTEQQYESFTKKLLKLCLVGDNGTGKTTRIEKFLQAIAAERVFYATDLIEKINDREEYKRFLIHNYLPEVPCYLFIKQGDDRVLRVLKERLVGKNICSENIVEMLNRFKEEQEDLSQEILEASMVLSLFDGIVPPERTVAELRGEFLKAARVALLVEGIKTAQTKSNKEPMEALSYVLRMLGTKESLLTLPGKEEAWGALQEAVENSAIYELCQGAKEQLSLANGRLKLSKDSEAHFTGILYGLLKQRADTKLLKLKPKMESVKQLAQVCKLLVQLPAIDALVVDHVAWDPKTLSKFMREIAEAPCSVLVTSTVAPEPAEGWLMASTR
jgi:ABC-type cobalamin/Fe3+-siderophores transport system ATPase subunit|tara:strand:+ start:1327 stop:2337 length:1011 start_codon:yes stop_codon:yes gene_type:complete